MNIHPSLLPLYRGAAPVQRALQVHFILGLRIHCFEYFTVLLYKVIVMTFIHLCDRMELKKQEYHWHSLCVHLMLGLSLPVKDWKLTIKLRYASLELLH